MSRNSTRNWIDEYVKYTANQESPEIFRRWVGFFILSSVVRRCVWFEMNDYILFPNMYLLLVAESGCRKSSAHGPGIDLLYKIQKRIQKIKIFHEKMTAEGLLKEMNSGAYQIPGTSRIIPDGSVTIVCDELSNLFNKKSYSEDLVSLFTSAYGGKSRQGFLTRNKENLKISNPNIGILAATTPQQLGDIFRQSAISGGFFGRVVVVTGQATQRIPFPMLKRDLEDYLLSYLEEVSNLYGKVDIEDEAKEEYRKWYSKLSSTPEQGILEPFWQRIHDHIFKTAMLLSLAEGTDKIISLKQFKKAKKYVYEIGKDMEHALRYLSTDESLRIVVEIADIIKKSAEIDFEQGTITRAGLTRRLHRRCKPTDLDDYLDILVTLGRVELCMRDNGVAANGKKKKATTYYKAVW